MWKLHKNEGRLLQRMYIKHLLNIIYREGRRTLFLEVKLKIPDFCFGCEDRPSCILHRAFLLCKELFPL